MTEIRALFGETIIELSGFLLESTPELVERFDGPSALAEFSVRGLAGHLRRAMTSLDGYLDRPGPAAGAPGTVTAARYYATVLGDSTDIDSDLHRSVRQRGLEAAPGDPDAFALEWADVAGALVDRLVREPSERLIEVYGGLVMTLDEYLVTRLVELVVHGDDLAVSLGVAPPPLPPAATGLVITTLVEVARLRHGDSAVVRALARRERDTAGALRVI
ncbi:MAG TPA: maleylpyruvate isomerase N-terminal domain-containing protein [Acidimicrobiia bacterium]|nr:maleylpyruvate isomerase N-terminal domain-containing protein [Acidimicrobiia bacterium]